MKKTSTRMGKILGFGIGAALLLAMAAGFVAAQAGSEVLARLGIDKAAAGPNVLRSLTSGYIFDSTAAKAFKALPASARAEVARAGLSWVKAYAGSAEFKTAYKQLRESRKPKPPDPVSSAEETLAKMKADLEKGIENIRQVQATADAETKKSYEQTIKQLRAQMEEMDKNPQMKEMLSQGVEAERVSKKNAYEADLKSWNENLPEDPGALIAKRIRQFLATSADVDYSAELISRGDRKVFVKEEYEQKSAYWKTCFRAGKEATEAASAFAKAWLAELEKN
jgi:hypothetical protein